MPSDTRALLGPNAAACDSRSLFLDRFPDPAAKDSGDIHLRRDWFNSFRGMQVWPRGGDSRREWITAMTADGRGELLFAQLQSRLIVNMAGGVMENAGLCLDRFGLPYIPGSAVKGCGRRAALAALHEWCETGQKPGAAEADQDNLFKAACADFPTPAAMLAAIARVFGWGEQDWKTRDEVLKRVSPKSNEDDTQFEQRCQKLWEEKRSDFAWACGVQWDATRTETLGLLGSAPAPGAAEGGLAVHSAPSPEERREAASTNGQVAHAPRVKDFAGSVSFLHAYPVDLPADAKIGELPVPPLGKLELDVVTCHHGKYYAEPDRTKKPREWEEWNQRWGTAPDTEEPVPVVFPAVAPGHVFIFALGPLRGADAKLLGHARAWLKTGLETFGLGAKTNAGYGWFADVTAAIQAAESAEKARQVERDRQAHERLATENARASLQPDPALLEELRAMKEADLRGQINPFATEERFWSQKDERVQLTLLHFLTVTAPELLPADRANPKSKLAKALANLSTKFPRVPSPSP